MLEKLFKIGKRLLTETDVEQLLTQAIDGAIEITRAERGMILLFRENDPILFQTARNLDKQDIENPRFEISRTIIETVRKTSVAFYSENALDDPSLKKSASAARLNLLSVICEPLVFESSIFGVLYLDNRSVREAFEPEVAEFAAQFADFISLAAHHALERNRLQDRVTTLEKELRERFDFKNIIGNHPKMIELLKIVTRIADSDATVLIHGETGTGKELIARAIHYNSSRKNEPFISINCGALQESLVESELFGHVRGAFTDAKTNKIGWLERANQGTIFLDEVVEMSSAVQVKLLRVLQTGEYSPVGSSEARHTDIRVIAATNKDLQSMVQNGSFREDLYYRLNVIDLLLPPLRERKSDLPMLIQHFLHKYGEQKDRGPFKLSRETEALMFAHDYPGNIRELENIIERAIVLSENQTLEPRHLPLSLLPNNFDATSTRKFSTLTEAKRQAAEQAERQFVEDCLQTTAGHISNAAKMAGIDVGNFHRIMKKHQIEAAHFKKTRN